MIEIVLASSNPHKIEEMNQIAKYSGIKFILPPKDFNPCETGKTFEQNAYIKAHEASLLTSNYALADDTGLCVDYLNGSPGIHSARYAPSTQERINKLLSALKGVSRDKRKAYFICVMVLTDKNGKKIFSTQGKIEGYIIEKPKGINGFGYDPIFFIEEFNKTMAQLNSNEKNLYSHRAKALLSMIEKIKEKLYY